MGRTKRTGKAKGGTSGGGGSQNLQQVLSVGNDAGGQDIVGAANIYPIGELQYEIGSSSSRFTTIWGQIFRFTINDYIQFQNDIAYWTSANNNVLTVDGTNQFVGINNTVPSATLELGAAGLSDATFKQTIGSNGNDAVWYYFPGDYNVLRINGVDNQILFNENDSNSWRTIFGGTSGSYPVTIKSYGNNPIDRTYQFGIQTTLPDETGIALDNLGAGGGNYGIVVSNNNSVIGGGCFAIRDSNAGATRFKIDSNGQCYCPTGLTVTNYSFPDADGGYGQVLTTDGAGSVSFQPSAGIISFKQAITALEASTLNSVPIDIADLPAAGVGYAWEIISYTVKYVVGATEYDFSFIYIIPETALSWQADYDYGSVVGGSGTIISRGDITGASVSGNKSTVIENKKCRYGQMQTQLLAMEHSWFTEQQEK